MNVKREKRLRRIVQRIYAAQGGLAHSNWEELEHGLKGMPLPEYIERTAKGTLLSINGTYFIQRTEKINE